MPARSAKANWKGSLMNGSGMMYLESGSYKGRFTFASRFEKGSGTNPEELIAGAHAGCFSMELSGLLSKDGFLVDNIETSATVHIERAGGGFEITVIELTTKASVRDIDEEAFLKYANIAIKSCPVSKALGAVKEIRLKAELEPGN